MNLFKVTLACVVLVSIICIVPPVLPMDPMSFAMFSNLLLMKKSMFMAGPMAFGLMMMGMGSPVMVLQLIQTLDPTRTLVSLLTTLYPSIALQGDIPALKAPEYDAQGSENKPQQKKPKPKYIAQESQYSPKFALQNQFKRGDGDFQKVTSDNSVNLADIQEAEEFLERQIQKLMVRDPELASELTSQLRSAYAYILDDLGAEGERNNTIPKFIENAIDNSTSDLLFDDEDPMKTGASSDAPLRIDQELYKKDISRQIRKYFALLSTFNFQNCFEKLICNIHTRTGIGGQRSPNGNGFGLTSYEQNIVVLFKLLNMVLTEDELASEPIVREYVRASRIGEQSLYQSEICDKFYTRCPFSANEIISMGIELDGLASPTFVRNS